MTEPTSNDTQTPVLRHVLVEYKARSKMGEASERLLWQKIRPLDDDIGNILQLDQALGESLIYMPDAGDVLEPLFSERDIPSLDLGTLRGSQIPKLKGFAFHGEQTPVIMNESEAIVFGGPLSGGTRKKLKASTSFVAAATATQEAITIALKSPEIIEIWDSPQVIHFDDDNFQNPKPLPPKIQACPLSTNLSQGGADTPIGTTDDMLNNLEIKTLHDQNFQGKSLTGDGVTVGVMDGGIVLNFDKNWPVRNVKNGYPTPPPGSSVAKWGTKSYFQMGADKTPHANHVSHIVSAIAPSANIYDYRLTNGASKTEKAFLGEALVALQDALERFRTTGHPKILNCSWGITYHLKNSQYARDSNHPVSRKFVEAMDEGMIIIFAAGNCGAPCSNPNSCFTESGTIDAQEYHPTNGPGLSILGMNGHRDVICVAGVTTQKEYITYSSQGPAVMSPHKNPDLCAMSHFMAYRDENFSGTSCAAPVISGIVALMVQKHPLANQEQIKRALTRTANRSSFVHPASNPAYTGAGVVSPRQALDELDLIMEASAVTIA